jgi:phospholipase C
MSTCTKWVDSIVITCKDWASKVDYECTSWADEGSYKCDQWADEGSYSCQQWADKGSSQCTSWAECHWYTPWNCIAGFFCRAWYWVANWVCQAWYWVARWVCKAWYWVAKWACKAFAWVVKAVCTVWGWIAKLVCVAWDTLRCAFLAIISVIVALFGGRPRQPKIEHVFVLMLENRSFDHVFGFSGLKGVTPDGAPTSIIGADPATQWNFDSTTSANIPVSQPADFSLSKVDVNGAIVADKDPGHEFCEVMTSLCGDGVQWTDGDPYPPITNSGFVANYRNSGSAQPRIIMRCFGPGQLPVMTTLAQEFAVCDQWFSSLPGPTWPNRFFAMAATSGGLDGSPDKWDIVTSTAIEGYRFENGNIFDLLDDYCLPWRIFHGDDFPVAFALSGMNLNALQGRLRDFDDFASEVNKPSFDDRFVWIEPKYGAHKFDITGPGDFTCGDSMHPLDDITRGEQLIKVVYETIRNSPHWERSMLVVMFDEHGGFYDHVAPPAATPPGDLATDSYIQFHFRFDRLGVRVPALVISPYTRRGTIDHSTYDHTSMLATLEKLFGMRHLTARDSAAATFDPLFALPSARPDAPTALPSPAPNPHPLDCEADDDSDSGLKQRLAVLQGARATGEYLDLSAAEYELAPSQIGFLQVALLRATQGASYEEKLAWLDEYRGVETGLDAAVFMTEAKLKVKHGISAPLANRVLARRRPPWRPGSHGPKQ